MYFKLAFQNVRKSYKDFLIYFLTLAFSVCLFYTFNSFQDQQAVMQLSDSQASIIEALSTIMNMLSIFVAIILAFLILYANNFLIKRRKKELGIYTLLGMPRRKISMILIYETLLIGILSLISGMIAGLFLSQILTAVTAGLFEVPLNYHFVFSTSATIITILAFTTIFLIIMIFNTFVLNRFKLITLLQAGQVNEKLKLKKVWMSLLLFIISLILIGWAYYTGIDKGLLAVNHLVPIMVAGAIGTLLFFMSLAGFLLTILKSNKQLYFRKLNCFVLRQLNANINTNFISMSIVCLMLLLSIGALATGLNLSATLNKAMTTATPYDYSYANHYYMITGSPTDEKSNTAPQDLQGALDKLNIDPKYIAASEFIDLYEGDLRLNDPSIMDHIQEKDIKELFQMESAPIVVSLTDYNKVRKARDIEPLTLQEDEVYFYTNFEMVSDAIHDVIAQQPTLTLFTQQLKVANTDFESVSFSTNNDNGYGEYAIMIVNDDIIPATAKKTVTYWNVNLTDRITPQAFDTYITDQMSAAYSNGLDESGYLQSYYGLDKDTVLESNKGLSVVFTYIGIYLGIVFMIASAVILALQQLSQANDNKKRYQILTKIGASKRMMNHSVFTQIAVYFLLPLLLAIVHSVVGIQIVNNLIVMFGKGDIFMSSLFTAGIISLIYGSYFLITYLGYKNILKS